jgi:hypothetical protein
MARLTLSHITHFLSISFRLYLETPLFFLNSILILMLSKARFDRVRSIQEPAQARQSVSLHLRARVAFWVWLFLFLLLFYVLCFLDGLWG